MQQLAARFAPNLSRIKEFALAGGVLLWAWLVWHTGPATLLESLKHVGWGMIILVAIAAVRHAIRTVACQWAMGAERAGFSFLEMYAISLISEAIKFLALAGIVFGESAKGVLLAQRVSAARAVSSVVLDVVLYQFSAGLFFLAGAFWIMGSARLEPGVRSALWITAGVMSVVLVTIAVGFARRWRSTRKLVAKFGAAGSSSAPWKRWVAKHEEKIGQASGQVSDFYHHHAGLFYGILLFDLLAHSASAFEVQVALGMLGHPLGYGAAVAIEALTKLVRISGAVVPANIGVFEGGTALILIAFGLSPAAGVALGVVRQLRSLLWAAAGLLMLPLWPSLGRSPRN